MAASGTAIDAQTLISSLRDFKREILNVCVTRNEFEPILPKINDLDNLKSQITRTAEEVSLHEEMMTM